MKMKEVYIISTNFGILPAVVEKTELDSGEVRYVSNIVGMDDITIVASNVQTSLTKLKVFHEIKMSIWLDAQLIGTGVSTLV